MAEVLPVYEKLIEEMGKLGVSLSSIIRYG
jgi:hypothetical protein